MAKFKKVLKGLECCLFKDGFGDCEDCPYRIPGGCDDLLRDALKLLKAQEPRLLSGEDLRKIASESINGCVWFERKDVDDPDMWFEGWANPIESCETDMNIYDFGNEVPMVVKKCMYGKTWRCWTSRPTDEQRKEVKWD